MTTSDPLRARQNTLFRKKSDRIQHPVVSSYDPEDDPQTRSLEPGLRYRTLNKAGSSVFLPRLVERNMTFHQSKNNIAVSNINGGRTLWPLLLKDWFHVFLRVPFIYSIMGLLVIWILMVLFFAGMYILVDNYYENENCGLGKPGYSMTWGTAFAFSLETATTVGYGMPNGINAFFEANCPDLQVTIFFQMTSSMMFNAFLFAFFYTSLARCESRASQVVFSDKLIIHVEKSTGKILISTRCYDIDAKYPVVEAHVRMYVMDRRLQLHLLRLRAPDDDVTSFVHISVPTEIHHHVDHHSALSPRGMPLVADSGGLSLRSADATACNREEVVCPVCGEGYGTHERLRNHVQYQRTLEMLENYPVKGTHQDFVMPDIIPLTLQEIKTHIESFMSEIIVIVEGIDPQVSGTFQAIQSYKYEDIAWEGEFEPCLKVSKSKFCVDLAKFHQVRMPLSRPNSEIEPSSELVGGVVSPYSNEKEPNINQDTMEVATAP